MRKVLTGTVLCAAMAVSACGDETEPAEPVAITPAGAITEDQADVLEDQADTFEESLPEGTQDGVRIEEATDSLEEATDEAEEATIEEDGMVQ